MSKLLYIIVLGMVGIGAWLFLNRPTVCERTFEYSIGDFNNDFGISRQVFLDSIKKAEDIWETPLSFNFFNYRANADFNINLIFDERQIETNQAEYSRDNIGATREYYNIIKKDYDNFVIAYNNKEVEYNSALSIYEISLNKYNIKVNSINNSGGATRKELDDLEKERLVLKQSKSNLEAQRVMLNNLGKQANLLGRQLNDLAKELNLNVEKHNERFGEAREFDQGDYRGDSINIYQFEDMSDLVLVLAHELGHALGLDHVPNSSSIMYYLMDEQDMSNLKLSTEDIRAVKDICRLK